MLEHFKVLRTKGEAAVPITSTSEAAEPITWTSQATKSSEGLFLEKIRIFLGALRSGLNGAVRGGVVTQVAQITQILGFRKHRKIRKGRKELEQKQEKLLPRV